MVKTVLITSCKGGIGKSTVAANLAMALAMAGHTVIAVDCDFSMRCLDLIMGHENDALFNLHDVIAGKCGVSKALVRDSRVSGLYFLAAPSSRTAIIDKDGFAELAAELKATELDGRFADYIILDAPGADDESIDVTAPVCDEAIIVCSHMPSAIRAAEYTGELLNERGVESRRLLINSFDVKSALQSKRIGIIEMIDTSGTKLIGIVPFDRTLMLAQEKGKLIDSFTRKNNARSAFLNIAERLEGRQIPLFRNFEGREYRKLLQGG